MGGEILRRQLYRSGIFRGPRGALLAVFILGGIAMLAVALDPPMAPLAGMARAGDGDSFRLGDDRIRLLGIDAPELSQDCDTADGGRWPCGRTARNRMAALLSGGAVDCQPRDRDQYDRLLATCRVGGRDIAAMMVGEGLAVASGDYATEEAAARRQGLGVWAGGFDTPRHWRDDHARPRGVFGWLSDRFR